MREHARDGQPGLGCFIVVVLSIGEARVVTDGVPSDDVERDALAAEVRGCCDDDGGSHAIRVIRRPGQNLESAERAADDGEELLELQMVEEPTLTSDRTARIKERHRTRC